MKSKKFILIVLIMLLIAGACVDYLVLKNIHQKNITSTKPRNQQSKITKLQNNITPVVGISSVSGDITVIQKRSTNLYRQELSCILDMQDDAMWLHRSEDGRPPFRNIFPRHSKNLILVKEAFERIFLFYLRYL